MLKITILSLYIEDVFVCHVVNVDTECMTTQSQQHSQSLPSLPTTLHTSHQHSQSQSVQLQLTNCDTRSHWLVSSKSALQQPIRRRDTTTGLVENLFYADDTNLFPVNDNRNTITKPRQSESLFSSSEFLHNQYMAFSSFVYFKFRF